MAEAALTETPGAEPNVVLRWATPADTARILDLVRVALGEGSIPRTEAFWRWKHEQNPFGRSPAMVAEADGRIVSLRIFLRWRWRYGERVLEAVRPVDTATHPEWRRRGLFERLTRELVAAMRAEGIAFLFNTPNVRSGQGYQKLGWHNVGRPTIWVRLAKPVQLLKGFERRKDPQGSVEGSQAHESPSPAILGSPDLAAFLGRAACSPSRLVTDADAAYLAWRYRECPGLNYGAGGAFDRTSGALVVFRRTMRQGRSELRLCDLFVAGDRASRSKGREALRGLLREHDVDLATARAMPGTAQAMILLRCGFLPVPRIGPMLVVRPVSESTALPTIDHLSAWSASIGDMEVF